MKPLSDISIFSVSPPLVFGNRGRRIYSSPREQGIQVIPLLMNVSSVQPFYSDALFRGRVGPQYRYRQENVPYFGIEYVREGSLAVRRQTRCYLIEPGEIFILHPMEDCEIATGPDGFCVKDSLSVRGPLLEKFFLQAFGVGEQDVFSQFDSQKLDLLLDRLSKLAMKTDVEDQIANSVLTYEILEVIVFSRKRSPQIPKLESLLNFMRSNLNRRLTLNELAAFSGCSKTTLLLAFRDVFGKTPHQKLIDLRMETAAGLLISRESLSVKEIADRTGYPNPMNFSSAFRRYYGIPPLQYRKEKINASLFSLSGVSL